MKKALLALLVAAALPATARAGDVTMVARDIPLGSRALQGVAAPIRFNMLGLHWQGPGTVLYRTRAPAGHWSPWAAADADSGPDAGSAEARPAWRDGNLVWTGTAIAVRYRTEGTVRRLRAFYLWSRVDRRPQRSLSIAGSPAIVPRADWQADEKIVRVHPLYAPSLRLAIVHHTAGTNDYTAAQAPAIVRGIEIYHVEANGWNDIGYNFLIDRFGTVYEGRGGGIARNVIGAHAEGFNTGSVGVALIGNFSRATPTPPMQTALVRLLAWRLDVAHLDPLSTVHFRSGGNAKFRAGRVVSLRAISGHRDTGPTDCPGHGAYVLLPSIAKEVAATGLPKLYEPRVSHAAGGAVQFEGRFSSALPWTVTVTDPAGKVVASHSARSAAVDWSWSPAGAGRGPFRWAITGGPGLLPAEGTLRAAAASGPLPAPAPPLRVPPAAEHTLPLLPSLDVFPAVLNPAANGAAATLAARFSLGSPAAVTAEVVKGTAPVSSLLSANVPAGPSRFEWNMAGLPDGRYSLVVTARPETGVTVTRSAPFVVDRTLSALTVGPPSFSPNGDRVADTLSLGFTLARSAPVQVTVQRQGVQVATILAAQLGPGSQSISWDGSAAGARLPDGDYVAVVTETDPFGTVSLLAPFTIDTTAPTLSLVDPATLRFRLDEPATVTAVVNGHTTVLTEPGGTFALPGAGGAVSSFRVQATDAAGNSSRPLSGP